MTEPGFVPLTVTHRIKGRMGPVLTGGMASPSPVDMTSTGDGYPRYTPHVPSGEPVQREATIPPASSLPDAIEQIRAERDILRRRVEERAHDCANVEAERDRLREENEQLKQMLVSASQAELTPGVPFSAPGVPSSREPLYVYRPMTQAEVEAQVEKNRWGTDE